MPDDTRQTAGYTRDQVNRSERRVTVQRFGERAQIPQAPHVESDVNDADMHEDAGEQPPPLGGESERSPVRSPIHDLLRGWIRNRNTGQRHPQEHGHIDSEQNLCNHHGTRLPPKPGRRFYALDRFFRFQPPLGSFVLNTPGTDLLPKRKGRKVAPAFDTIRHRLEPCPVPLSWMPRSVFHRQKLKLDEEPEYSDELNPGISLREAPAWLTSLPGGRRIVEPNCTGTRTSQ